MLPDRACCGGVHHHSLSPANFVAAAITVPGTDSIPHYPACLSFCTTPPEGQEAPVLRPLIPCGRIGENTRLSPWCNILVERPQSKVAWLSVPNCVTKSIDGSIDSSVLSKTVSSLGSTIDPKVGLVKILVLQFSKCLSLTKDWSAVYCIKHS